MPILWHIMKIYSTYGYNDFIVCLGYKGYVIKEYFANYFLHQSDVTINLKDNTTTVHNNHAEPWTISLVDTGIDTMTGGRIKRIQSYINKEPFMLTYGDGVGNVDINKLVEFHTDNNKYCTVTTVQPSGRFGALSFDDNGQVSSFEEKPSGDGAWINGGFFVCEPQVFDYIDDDSTIWERKPMENLTKDRQMIAFRHTGFWRPMDTLRDKNELEEAWTQNTAKWKIW
jgi:glucose-1-phosphate cytidylyltransferase